MLLSEVLHILLIDGKYECLPVVCFVAHQFSEIKLDQRLFGCHHELTINTADVSIDVRGRLSHLDIVFIHLLGSIVPIMVLFLRLLT